MKQRVALILGATPFSIPLIIEAKSKGFYTVVCSNNENDPGLIYADESQLISILDYDGLFVLCEKIRPEVVTCAASDLATLGVAKLNQFLSKSGLNENQVTAVSNKGNFSSLLLSLNLPYPKSFIVNEDSDINEIISNIKFPAIMKPFFSSGSRGVKVVRKKQEILNFHTTCMGVSALEKGYVIQSFLNDYKEVGCECFIIEGRVMFIQLTNKFCNSKNVPIGHCAPVRKEFDFSNQITHQIELICGKLNVKSSAINLDIMVKEGAQPIIIDMSFRLGGNLLPSIMKQQFGINPFDVVLKIAAEEAVELDYIENEGYIGSIIFGSSVKTIFTNKLKKRLEIYFEDSLELVFDFNTGESISEFTQGNNRFGHALVKTKSIEEYENILFNTQKIIETN